MAERNQSDKRESGVMHAKASGNLYGASAARQRAAGSARPAEAARNEGRAKF